MKKIDALKAFIKSWNDGEEITTVSMYKENEEHTHAMGMEVLTLLVSEMPITYELSLDMQNSYVDIGMEAYSRKYPYHEATEVMIRQAKNIGFTYFRHGYEEAMKQVSEERIIKIRKP